MKRLDPAKLFVEFRPGVTKEEPIFPRHYTLTHSDVTAELFLTIGLQYAYEKIGPMRDEVLAEWRLSDGRYYMYVYLYVDGQFDPIISATRYSIFKRELPLALEAIRYGDRAFFEAHPELDNAAIWVYFDSTIPLFNRSEFWGFPANYK
ncbi:staygreen family protein [Phosphitispora sp. TUW77]|uniref:staygreen family protein n=1 Tax=Phosphitispora sp. TUW77 TaxID=3152361 RepID=UPI003AB5D87E